MDYLNAYLGLKFWMEVIGIGVAAVMMVAFFAYMAWLIWIKR